MGKLKITYLPTGDLIPYARNSRTHTDEQIAQVAASIREFGFASPVLIGEDKTIIAGHCRVMAAQKLGLETVPTITATGWTEAQKRAYVIVDNRLAENAGWDVDMLKTEFADLDELGFDLSLLGFDDSEMADLLADDETTEPLTDPDEIPEPEETPVTRAGDIWTLGNHRLMCGDSTNGADVALLMDGERADMVFTDPPYNDSSQTGEVVLDVFGGSGTTLIAAETTGRKCRMMELSPKYCDIIIHRWQNLTGKQATMNGKTYDQLREERSGAEST